MIKQVIFDIGNVLVNFNPYPYLVELLEDEAKAATLLPMFAHEAWGQYDQGLLYLEDLAIIYHQQYPALHKEVDLVLANWMKLMKPLPETYAYLCELKQQGYQIYLLSNISKDSADYLKATQPFFAASDGMVLSYEEHLIKPDKKLFNILLDRYQLIAEECLFFDDAEKNIEAAKALGIHSVQFHTIQQARTEAETQLARGHIC